MQKKNDASTPPGSPMTTLPLAPAASGPTAPAPSTAVAADAAASGAAAPAPGLDAAGVRLMASGAGLAVATLYLSQPLLGRIGADLALDAAGTGALPTLTLLGYALGIGLLAPLGDRIDRRRLVLAKAGVLTLALALAALAPGAATLMAASLAIGLAATLAQDLVPAAATLAAPAERGRTVGSVMTGLLLGILLSRVVAGALGEPFGWRVVYGMAALGLAGFAVAAWRGLPAVPPTSRLGYAALLGSLAALWRRHPALRRAATAQGLLALGFSAFWSTLAVMLHARHGLGAAAAGAFGLAGAAGALVAPWAGRAADRRGPAAVARGGIALALAAFAGMALAAGWQGPAALAVLVLGAVVFDVGMQATLVAHQTLVYGLDPDARSRLNALLFTGMFAGMASGAALGSLALAHAGWLGVLLLASAAAAAALWVRRRA